MPPPSTISATIEFGRFTVMPLRRQLFADGVVIELGGRAFEVLFALIEAQGAVVSKDELIRRVWPSRIAEENNLHAQITTLRKALAPDRDLIQTVAGRGYRFVGVIRPNRNVRGSASITPTTNLSEPVSELIGREADLEAVTELLERHRLVTLIGAGGIGKTRLGLEVARRLRGQFPDGVWAIELAALSDSDLVLATVAGALKLDLGPGALSPERVANSFGSRQALLLLDNCDHVVDAVARMAQALLGASPFARVLATSRESLRAEGEYLYWVPPLQVPDEGIHGREELLRFGAVRLFVTRAHAAEPRFSADGPAATIAANICRRLDGIPLAIELAAARTAALGIESIAARLDDRFRLLAGGQRAALPRHQTLRATLDWSYELLPESERVLLYRIAVFKGRFTLESANAVIADASIAPSAVDDGIVNLVAKSLLTVIAGDSTQYRLLETTRAYALEKLVEHGEFASFARRHASYYRDLFERAAAAESAQPTAEWLAAYGRHIDNLRCALDWAFSENGDSTIGIALTVATVPLWFQFSLVDECRRRVERALAAFQSGSSLESRREMQLYAALGWSLMYTASPARETGAAWAAALEIAEQLGDTDYRLRALWGIWGGHVNNGEFRAALELAKTFSSIALSSSNPADPLVGDRMIGVALHFLGDQKGARLHIERMLSGYVTPTRRTDFVRFQFDQRVTAGITLARVLWLQGLADQALRTVEETIADAVSINHTLSLCNALAQMACPVALFAGDLVAAERYIDMLLHNTAKHGLDIVHAYGGCFRGMLLIKRGNLDSGLPPLQAAVDELRKTGFVQYYTTFVGALAEGLASAARVPEAMAMIDDALQRSENKDERWLMPEMLRIKGELLLQAGEPNAAAAENHFQQALEWARRQEVLSWELRCAISLARLWYDQGQIDQASQFLAPIYRRFTEGFGTIDLLTARTLLESFGDAPPAGNDNMVV